MFVTQKVSTEVIRTRLESQFAEHRPHQEATHVVAATWHCSITPKRRRNSKPNHSIIRTTTHILMSLPSTSSRQCLSDEMVYRSLLQVAPTTMLQLCRRGDWHRVMYRIHRHPHEVVEDCLLYAIRATGYQTSSSSTLGLSIAVVQALLEINPQQIQVLHPLTGTIVHEAIQYWCPNTIIEYLLQEAIFWNTLEDSSKNLLAVQDDIGRTLLHCMVGRWQRFHVSPSTMKMSGTSSKISDVQLFSLIHEAHSSQARVRDIDGYTPLLLLLQTPPPPSFEEESNGLSPQEAEIAQMVQCMFW